MKKILIVNNNLHIGGVQKALVNLLHEVSGKYEITLLLFSACGKLLDRVPGNVRVITPDSPFRWWGLTKEDCKDAGSLLRRAFWAGMTRMAGRGMSARAAGLLQEKIRGFDTAVSFLHSGPPNVFYGGCNEFVLQHVEAGKKVTFLHCDYGAIHADCRENTKLYGQFDRIAACSEGCRDSFLRKLPQFSAKTSVVPNCHNYPEVRTMADAAPVRRKEDRFYIVTVSRFGREKALLRAIGTIASLRPEERAKIRYDIIGSGPEYAQAVRLLRESGLEDTVVLHGEMENPYGFLRAADVLLIPSLSEAAPLVIGEAASLGTPILTTETSSAREMVEQTGWGWVCVNSEEGIRNGIRRLLYEPDTVQETKRRMEGNRLDDHYAGRCFMELID